MAQEIERKFLVKGDFKQHAYSHDRIVQGYLSSVPQRTVRIRIRGGKGFLTIKGQNGINGLSRYEWEKEIPVAEAEELLKLCEPGAIDKIRYLVKAGPHIFEVDEFHGVNEGLIMAEIELEREDEPFEHPEWLGDEVTGIPRYYNSILTRHPYTEWQASSGRE